MRSESRGAILDYQHDELEIEDGNESLGTRFTNQRLHPPR